MLDDVLIGCPCLCLYTKAGDLCPWRRNPHSTVWLLQCRMKVVVDIGKETMRWWLHIRNKGTRVWGRRIEGKRRESVEGTGGSRGVRKLDFSEKSWMKCCKQRIDKDWEADIWDVRNSGGLKEQEKCLRNVGTDPVHLIGPERKICWLDFVKDSTLQDWAMWTPGSYQKGFSKDIIWCRGFQKARAPWPESQGQWNDEIAHESWCWEWTDLSSPSPLYVGLGEKLKVIWGISVHN